MQQPPQGSPPGQISSMSVDQLRSLQVRCCVLASRSPRQMSRRPGPSAARSSAETMRCHLLRACFSATDCRPCIPTSLRCCLHAAQMQLAARGRAMQASGMPPDQLATNLQKLAMLQHQVGAQLARVRSPRPLTSMQPPSKCRSMKANESLCKFGMCVPAVPLEAFPVMYVVLCSKHPSYADQWFEFQANMCC